MTNTKWLSCAGAKFALNSGGTILLSCEGNGSFNDGVTSGCRWEHSHSMSVSLLRLLLAAIHLNCSRSGFLAASASLSFALDLVSSFSKVAILSISVATSPVVELVV